MQHADLGSLPGSESPGLAFAAREKWVSTSLYKGSSEERIAYDFTAALIEGAHSSIELIN
jgi:hypothetical protein